MYGVQHLTLFYCTRGAQVYELIDAGEQRITVPFLQRHSATCTKSLGQLERALRDAKKLHADRGDAPVSRASRSATTDDLHLFERLDRLRRCMGMLGQTCPPRCPGNNLNSEHALQWSNVKYAFATVLLPDRAFNKSDPEDWARVLQTYM